MTIFNDRNETRPTSSTLSGSGVLHLSRAGSYSLLSPLSFFQESDVNSTFSYPPGIISYKRENPVNDESFVFSIDSHEPDIVKDSVSLFPVPQFQKIAVLRIDGILQEDLSDLKSVGSVDVKAVGKITGASHTFRMNLVPTTSRIEVRSL